MGYDSCEPFWGSGRAVVDDVVQGEVMGFGILLELHTGRKRAKIKDDFTVPWYEGWLLWDDIGELFDKRLLCTPIL